jgi:hypothetical protein
MPPMRCLLEIAGFPGPSLFNLDSKASHFRNQSGARNPEPRGCSIRSSDYAICLPQDVEDVAPRNSI